MKGMMAHWRLTDSLEVGGRVGRIKDLHERYDTRQAGIPGIPQLYQNLNSTKKFVGARMRVGWMQLELHEG